MDARGVSAAAEDRGRAAECRVRVDPTPRFEPLATRVARVCSLVRPIACAVLRVAVTALTDPAALARAAHIAVERWIIGFGSCVGQRSAWSCAALELEQWGAAERRWRGSDTKARAQATREEEAADGPVATETNGQ